MSLYFDAIAALERAGLKHGEPPFTGGWDGGHWMTTPGIFYCEYTDHGTGPQSAPNNITQADNGSEIIWRQPALHLEFRQIVAAANTDAFGTYSANGLDRWTLELVRQWWQERDRLREALDKEIEKIAAYSEDCAKRRALIRESGRNIARFYQLSYDIDLWLDYLDNEMERDLRVFLFQLQERRMPREGDTLPEL